MKIKTQIPPKIYLTKDFGKCHCHLGVGEQKKDKRIHKVYVGLEKIPFHHNLYFVYTSFSSN